MLELEDGFTGSLPVKLCAFLVNFNGSLLFLLNSDSFIYYHSPKNLCVIFKKLLQEKLLNFKFQVFTNRHCYNMKRIKIMCRRKDQIFFYLFSWKTTWTLFVFRKIY